MTVKGLLCVQKLPWIIADGSPWDVCGVRNDLVGFLDSLDTFCIRRNKKREDMQEKRTNTTNRDKFSNIFYVVDI